MRAFEPEVAVLVGILRDPRTPWAARTVVLLVVAYAVCPIDPLPDALPGIGVLDELVVLPIGVAVALRLTPDPVVADARATPRASVASRRLRWLGAGLVVIGWVVVVAAVWWAIDRG